MEKEATGFLPAKLKYKTNINALPVAVAVIGASIVFMALMLFMPSEKNSAKDNNGHEVENYDVVGNIPFIYGVGR